MATTITIERNKVTGAYTASALVSIPEAGVCLERHVFMGERKKDIPALFRAEMKKKGYTIVKD